jgi:hypothetical protein
MVRRGKTSRIGHLSGGTIGSIWDQGLKTVWGWDRNTDLVFGKGPEGSTMGKIWAGFLIGAAIGFAVATAAFSGCQDIEVTTRAYVPGMAFGLPIGGLIGVLVGLVLERRCR